MHADWFSRNITATADSELAIRIRNDHCSKEHRTGEPRPQQIMARAGFRVRLTCELDPQNLRRAFREAPEIGQARFLAADIHFIARDLFISLHNGGTACQIPRI